MANYEILPLSKYEDFLKNSWLEIRRIPKQKTEKHFFEVDRGINLKPHLGMRTLRSGDRK